MSRYWILGCLLVASQGWAKGLSPYLPLQISSEIEKILMEKMAISSCQEATLPSPGAGRNPLLPCSLVTSPALVVWPRIPLICFIWSGLVEFPWMEEVAPHLGQEDALRTCSTFLVVGPFWFGLIGIYLQN